MLVSIFQLMRPKQWIKNVFVVMPLFFTPSALSAGTALGTLLAFLAFCSVSSAVYCLNDLRDRESDRLHPKKKSRPIASGRVSARAALVCAAVLLILGFALAMAANPGVALMIVAYLVLNVAYIVVLKKIAIIDVIAIALGFLLRIHAGAAAIDVTPTPWLQMCTGLLALFIALAKRRDDVVLGLEANHRTSLAGYTRPFLDACITVTVGALLVCYVIFTLDDVVMERLGSEKLFLTVPFVIAGTFRYLQLTLVYERSGSPTELVVKDAFLAGAVVGWLALYALLIYS